MFAAPPGRFPMNRRPECFDSRRSWQYQSYVMRGLTFLNPASDEM
jgi:hypothetical protein